MAIKISKKYMNRIIFSICILSIILIILIIFFLRLYLNRQENLLQRLLTGLDGLNYHYRIELENTDVYVVGKYEKRIDSKGKITYKDFVSKKDVILYPQSYYMEKNINNGIQEMDYYNRFIKTFFGNENYNYKYLGRKKLDGKKCIVVEFEDFVEVDGKKSSVIFWINDKVNIIEKAEYYLRKDGKKELIKESKFNFYTNLNSLSDVKVPDTVYDEYSTDTNRP